MVRRLTSPRLEFEAAAIYEYPEHLRSFLNDLPTRPGVYLFHGESDTMPDAPRDKRTYFREINYIAAAFQYQKKNYKSA